MCLCCVCRLRTFTVMHRWSVGFIVNGALQSSWLWLLWLYPEFKTASHNNKESLINKHAMILPDKARTGARPVSCRSTAASRAPSWANAWQTARPIPLPAPEITHLLKQQENVTRNHSTQRGIYYYLLLNMYWLRWHSHVKDIAGAPHNH